MPLELVLDASLPHLSEPGFWEFVSTRKLAEQGNPSDQASHQGIWSDEPTRTVMLRPLQLESSWLNTAAQVDSIIGLNQMVVASDDLSTTRVFEAPALGNNDNPYIFHRSVGPSLAFPAAVAPESVPGDVPGDGPSLVGIPSGIGPTLPSLTTTQGPTIVYQPSLTSVSNGPSTPMTVPVLTPIGAEIDGKFIGQSKARLDANQAMFFRWYQPTTLLGFPCIYEFYVGQYKLRIKDVVVEVFRDISSAGDRTSFKKVQVCPLFNVGSLLSSQTGSLTTSLSAQQVLDLDRSLLWLPFRRNQVLLYSSDGKWAVIQVNSAAKRLKDDSDWDITRSDTVLVWVITPAAGRFQVQKVKYPSGTIKMQSPTLVIDYTPSVAPTVTLTKDSDHGTTLTSAQSQPPSYTLPANDANDCPPATTTGAATDRRREFGVELSLTASSDHRWTPFFYGFTLEARRAFENPPTVPFVLGDHNPGSVFVGAEFSLGLTPGECHATCEVIDAPDSGYPVAPYYYRSSFAVQVYDSALDTVFFTGITKPAEVTAIREVNTIRRVTFPAQDRWKQLADTYLRDQRDWTTFGHVDVVKFIAEQGGIDCTLAEFPAGYVPANSPETGTINTVNSPLGGSLSTIAQQTKDLEQGWRPQARDTAATFIQRVADLYSGWNVGFRANGRFFYLPKTYFTTPTHTFTHDPADLSGNPRIFGQVTFTTEEPEANVIVVMAGNAVNGNVTASSTWIDWASIRNPAAANYLGRWRAEIVQIGGSFSCQQLNWIARTIWDQTRRRHRYAEFEGDYVPTLGIGHAFMLGTYGNYRLIGANAKLDRFNLHKSHYKAELIEAGV